MIIKDVKPQYKMKEAKEKVYAVLKMATSVFITDKVGMPTIIFLYFITLLPFISILFKYDDYFPSPISKSILFST